MMKLLPKKITSKMNTKELVKYEKLVEAWIQTGGAIPMQNHHRRELL